MLCMLVLKSDATSSAIAIGFPFAVTGLLALVYLAGERRLDAAFRGAAEELGLEFVKRKARTLRGELDGLRVDVVWQRRLGVENDALEGIASDLAGGSSRRSAMRSATAFRVRDPQPHVDLYMGSARGIDAAREDPRIAAELTPERCAALELLFREFPRASVARGSIRVGRGGRRCSQRDIVGVVRLLVETALALRADG